MVRAPHERTEGKTDPSRSPAAGRKQPPASGHSMNEELHWQPMASMDLDLDLDREQPPHLRISGAGRRPRALGYAGDPGVQPPGPQAQNRMALGVKGGGMLGQWYTLSPPPPVGQCQKPV